MEYEVIRREIRYPRLEFRTGRLVLILPMDYDAPERLIEKHRRWIEEKKRIIEEALAEAEKRKLVDRNEEDFRSLVKDLVAEASESLGVRPNRIFFRRMITKWASCSPSGNITINRLMRYLPEDHIRYVVYHEVAHLIERKHNEIFWRILSERVPEHRRYENELLIYWFLIQRRSMEDDHDSHGQLRR